MQTAITIITTAALVLHFSLGCWAHNEHTAGAVGCAVSHSHDPHSHTHGDEQHSEPAPTDDVPDRECSKGQCYFTNVGKIVFAVGADVSFYVPLGLPNDREGAEARIAGLQGGSQQLFRPAVRPHLFNQVILI